MNHERLACSIVVTQIEKPEVERGWKTPYGVYNLWRNIPRISRGPFHFCDEVCSMIVRVTEPNGQSNLSRKQKRKMYNP